MLLACESDLLLRAGGGPASSRTGSAHASLLLLPNGAAARWGYRQALKQGRDAVVRQSKR